MLQGTLVLLALLLTCVLATEVVLRRWSGVAMFSLKRRTTSFSSHGRVAGGSWNLTPEIIRSRDPHFSETHWSEMLEWNSIKSLESWRPSAEGPTLFRYVNSDFPGVEFSVKNGLRVTKGQPDDKSRRIFCLGGSTTFCLEVSDARTWPSVLQAEINESEDLAPYAVFNLGIPGTPGLERIAAFRTTLEISSGDVAVFLFGCNDAGWKMYGRRSGGVHDNLPFFLRQILRRLVPRSELAGWIYGELSPRYLRKLALEMAETTIIAAEESVAIARSRGAEILFVLQPNIFSLAAPEPWDQRIRDATARDLPVLLGAAYSRYGQWISKSSYAVSATHIFDSESPSPYMGDWAHVNTRGNQLIGNFVYNELLSRGMIRELESS